jgi:hypothetical protein
MRETALIENNFQFKNRLPSWVCRVKLNQTFGADTICWLPRWTMNNCWRNPNPTA